MAVKYLVCSPGRSGSIFVTLTIAHSLGIRPIMSNKSPLPVNDIPVVYHSHDAQLQLDPDVPVLHVTRNDVFAEIISAVISEQYNEWAQYSGNKPPFVADVAMFENKYYWHKYWHHAHRALTHYNNRRVLVFEEFIGNSQLLCDQLGIPRVHYKTEKSPYSQNNILNIAELREKFAQLEAVPPPDSWDREHWKDSRAL